MSPLEIGIIGIVALFFFMAIGLPVGFAMALVGFGGLIIIDGFGPAILRMGLVPFTTVASYIFSVLPLFVLMGEFSSISGIVPDAYRAMYTWMGRLPGGLAMATVGGCAGFAAVCGSSSATAATMTRIALPEMIEYKYDSKLAVGSLAAGGTMGILIPPSLPLILYGVIAEQSVGRLFMAGVFPGILEAVFYMFTIYILCKLNPLLGPTGARTSWQQKFAALKKVWGLLTISLLVLVGIWGGIFTPTEAGAVGAFFAFLFVLFKRRLTRQNLLSSFIDTIGTTGMAFGILIGAMIFGYFITVSRLPAELAGIVAVLPIPPLGILITILILYLIMGCFISSLAVLLLLTPIFLSLLSTLGFDLIWFGILMARMAEIGTITPPVGINVFVVKGMAKDISMGTVYRGVIPFIIADVFHVALLIVFPQLSLFLPKTMMASK